VVAGHKLQYMSGFGNEHSSEALPGALPVGQNSPQKVRTEAAATANGDHCLLQCYPLLLSRQCTAPVQQWVHFVGYRVSVVSTETACSPRPALRSPTSHPHVARSSLSP
jgi:hypothetical protein